MKKRCRAYVGVACVDGSCPKALREEMEDRCMMPISKCEDCSWYKGCEDCGLLNTEYCSKEDATLKAETVKQSSMDITKMDIRITDELMVEQESIEATYELWFDVDAYFGTDTRTNDAVWINFYTTWHSESNSITACYVIDSPDGNEDHEWELSEKEQQFFQKLMEEHAKHRYGKTLLELLSM